MTDKDFTDRDFTMWLHGFFELSNVTKLDERQVQVIKDHLDLLFDKVTPDRDEPIKIDQPHVPKKKKGLSHYCSSPKRKCNGSSRVFC